jgi:hypothetical protein
VADSLQDSGEISIPVCDGCGDLMTQCECPTKIICPTCNVVDDVEERNCVTYYGTDDTGPHRVVCFKCDTPYFVDEHVVRTYHCHLGDDNDG